VSAPSLLDVSNFTRIPIGENGQCNDSIFGITDEWVDGAFLLKFSPNEIAINFVYTHEE
jgi:hypothetical protein